MLDDVEARELLQQYDRGEITAGELEWELMTDADQIAIANIGKEVEG